jgi:hypothetical protein
MRNKKERTLFDVLPPMILLLSRHHHTTKIARRKMRTVVATKGVWISFEDCWGRRKDKEQSVHHSVKSNESNQTFWPAPLITIFEKEHANNRCTMIS